MQQAMQVRQFRQNNLLFTKILLLHSKDFWPNEGKDQPECPPASWDVYNEDSNKMLPELFQNSRKSFLFKTFVRIADHGLTTQNLFDLSTLKLSTA